MIAFLSILTLGIVIGALGTAAVVCALAIIEDATNLPPLSKDDDDATVTWVAELKGGKTFDEHVDDALRVAELQEQNDALIARLLILGEQQSPARKRPGVQKGTLRPVPPQRGGA